MEQNAGRSSGIRVKICGLTDEAGVSAAVEAGAAYVGFVMFPPSPRSLSEDAVARLAMDVPPGVIRVALLVDPDDAMLARVSALPIDMIQLHGRETPERVLEAKDATGLPIMKAIGVRERADLDRIADYAPVADQLLVDAKPPKGASRPGGNAIAFDWTLLSGRRWPVPWMLAGGLTADRIEQAVAVTGAQQLDVSSAVETAPGVKDPERIQAFLAAAGAAAPGKVG